MTPRHLTPFVATVLLGLVLVGCDAGDATDDTSDLSSVEDAAVSIANALGVGSGGAFEDLASAADAIDATAGRGASTAGCERSRDYDEATMTWTQFVACERGNPDGRFFAAFSRTQQLQFLAGGVPQQFPVGATSLLYEIVDGTGERRSPVFHHVLNDLGGSFDVDGLDEDLVTVNGTYTRAATDTLRTHRAVRTLDYTLDLTFIDVVGPRHRDDAHRRWGRAVSGTVEGRYRALVTFETRNGYRERDIDRTFTITFGDTEDPILTLGGRPFPLDLEAGTVDGLGMD